ncbi:hypothetical protein CAPTEDRAFT_189749 [Capitella teleta]|uniref:RRM domain-containing protein n=1 Tax=Capitella teleta TaxID=283909 RepID=R7U297_CAPTE|nr:hypothetical protein CAPTEDRAFT_189749 [Capitella teleta]|eukprot:ELU00125.1 hypothetical protein CAPTEDRAFT_189749 [Capitella teleta]
MWRTRFASSVHEQLIEPKEDDSVDNYRKGIVVGGIPADLSEEALRLYFEDEARSGGGAVKKLRIDRSTSTAIVTFTAAEAVMRVKNKSHRLQPGRLMYAMAIQEIEPPLVLKVSGLPQGLGEYLRLHFEADANGGPIERMDHVKDDYFIFFKCMRDDSIINAFNTISIQFSELHGFVLGKQSKQLSLKEFDVSSF